MMNKDSGEVPKWISIMCLLDNGIYKKIYKVEPGESVKKNTRTNQGTTWPNPPYGHKTQTDEQF